MIKDFLEVNFKTLTGSIKSFKDYKKEWLFSVFITADRGSMGFDDCGD